MARMTFLTELVILSADMTRLIPTVLMCRLGHILILLDREHVALLRSSHHIFNLLQVQDRLFTILLVFAVPHEDLAVVLVSLLNLLDYAIPVMWRCSVLRLGTGGRAEIHCC